MSAVSRALERGREAVKTDRQKAKFEPVDVEHRGWLVARVKDLRSGEVEGVFYAQGCWQFTQATYDSEGKPKSHDVRDAQLKRCAKAMIGTGSAVGEEWRDELVREVHAVARTKSEARRQEGAPAASRRGKS